MQEGEEEDGSYNDLFLKLNSLPWKQAEMIFVIFEFASKYCISESFVDYEGLLHISSKGFK